MNKILIITTIVTLAVFSACSDDETQKLGQNNGQLPILLGTSIGEETRSNTATNLISGDTVWVWTDIINGATQEISEYFKAWALKADGVGGLSSLKIGNTKLFPATNVLNFYALCGNFGLETEGDRAGLPKIDAENDPLPTTGIRHTVMSDQTTPEAYYKSDLLYAIVKNQEPISQAVVLPFKHMLSRIQVVLVVGNGVTSTDLNAATVKLVNLKRQISISPNKDADFTSQNDLAGMLSWSNLFSSGDILMETKVVNTVNEAAALNSTLYADAIVVPQTIASGATFIEVSYVGRTAYYRIPAPDDLVLESGKQYRFRLIANRIGSGYEATVAIDDWDDLSGSAMWME